MSKTPREEHAHPLTVGDLALYAHISVRTLHHYDALGLLVPARDKRSGYRVYLDDDVDRLQVILGYRACGLSLDDIAHMLEGGDDPVVHLSRQREALERRMELTRRQLTAIDKALEASRMNLNLTPAEKLEVFGDFDVDAGAAEAERRWGSTDAYRESSRRTGSYDAGQWRDALADQEAAVAQFVAAMEAGASPEDDAARVAAEAHRKAIDRWFYPCDHEMQCRLADMYVADPRFTQTYEKIRPGLATYVRDAILANAIANL